MLVTYLRSSSANAAQMCPFDYFLSYVLGLGKPSGKSALLGNALHKGLEILARCKLTEQRGEASFSDPETGREFTPADATPEAALDYGWGLYTDPAKTAHKFGPADMASLRDQLTGVLASPFNPLALDVVCPEQFFDFEIDAPWASYDWTDPHSGEPVRGRLALRGTKDLTFRTRGGVLAYCDWKTGTRLDWKDRSPKLYEHFYDDFQMLLYFLALRKLYPDEPAVELTIYWTRDGGPFTVLFPAAYEGKALAAVRRIFEQIRDAGVPARIKDDASVPDRTKPCGFCHFAKVGLDSHPASPSNPPACDAAHQRVLQLGVDRVVKDLGVPGKWRQYGSGGGVTNRDGKEG